MIKQRGKRTYSILIYVQVTLLWRINWLSNRFQWRKFTKTSGTKFEYKLHGQHDCVTCKTKNFDQPRPAAIRLSLLQSKHSTGENAYIDLLIWPGKGRKRDRKTIEFHYARTENNCQWMEIRDKLTKKQHFKVKTSVGSHVLFIKDRDALKCFWRSVIA